MAYHQLELALSIHDTQAIKGIALILLLCHHCLFEGVDYDDVIVGGCSIFQEFGIFCKLCVALFVFLSGYGLTVVAKKNDGIGSVFHFYRHRYAKLMINYWLIYLLFVPIGLLFSNRSFCVVYGENWIPGAVSDFLGLHQAIIGHPMGYNPTWWFYSCIIFLYLLYPLLWKFRRFWYLMIPLSLVIRPIIEYFPIIRSSLCCDYLPSFICGLAMSYLSPKIGEVKVAGKLLIFILFLFICSCRFSIPNPIMWDSVISIYLIVVYFIVGVPPFVSKSLAFIGRHSMNIFLFHAFIFYLYFHNVIYWSRNPVLICLTLLIVCIPISITIEWLKNRLCINQLQNRLSGQ